MSKSHFARQVRKLVTVRDGDLAELLAEELDLDTVEENSQAHSDLVDAIMASVEHEARDLYDQAEKGVYDDG